MEIEEEFLKYRVNLLHLFYFKKNS